MKAEIVMPHYKPGGEYQLTVITLWDVARNYHSFGLRSIDERLRKITIETDNPDSQPPTLDINRITINAKPTVPEAPNGETIVKIEFFVKDDISGYVRAFGSLRNPLGGGYNYGNRGVSDYPETDSLYFQGNPNIFRLYTATTTLPVGSTPGIWGLESMSVIDKAGNIATHLFTRSFVLRFPKDLPRRV